MPNISFKIKPFQVPNFAIVEVPKSQQETVYRGDERSISAAGSSTISIPLSDVDAQSLSDLCDEFRKSVFEKAKQKDPATEKMTKYWKGISEPIDFATNDGKLMATIISHDNGYTSDQEQVKNLGNIGDIFEVLNVSVDRSSTTITLTGIIGVFNSVNFNFTKNGEDYDIFSDPEIMKTFHDQYGGV